MHNLQVVPDQATREDPPASAVEIEPGIYAIRENGDFHTERLRALVNVGTRDCTAYVYARDFVSRCPCMKHVDNPQIRDHQAGELFAQQTIYASQPTMLNGFVPEGVPLTVRIAGFDPGGIPASVQWPAASAEELARREADRAHAHAILHLDTAPPPRARDLDAHERDRDEYRARLAQQGGGSAGDTVPPTEAVYHEAMQHDARLLMGQAPPPQPSPASVPSTPLPPATPGAAGLFPGFVVSCERCRSVNISLTTSDRGKSYLECEECGAMGRVRLD